MWTQALSLLVLIHISCCVIVKVGDFTFPLETLKKFKDIVDEAKTVDFRAQSDHFKSYNEMCINKDLPVKLKNLCDNENVKLIDQTFKQLERVADSFDECEVCAFAACTGC